MGTYFQSLHALEKDCLTSDVTGMSAARCAGVVQLYFLPVAARAGGRAIAPTFISIFSWVLYKGREFCKDVISCGVRLGVFWCKFGIPEELKETRGSYGLAFIFITTNYFIYFI